MNGVGRQRGLEPVTVISLMQGPMDIVILGFDKGLLVSKPKGTP